MCYLCCRFILLPIFPVAQSVRSLSILTRLGSNGFDSSRQPVDVVKNSLAKINEKRQVLFQNVLTRVSTYIADRPKALRHVHEASRNLILGAEIAKLVVEIQTGRAPVGTDLLEKSSKACAEGIWVNVTLSEGSPKLALDPCG